MSEREFLTEINIHQGIIHKLCKIYRDSPEDQQDCFQEILYHLWKSYPSFNGRSKISTWIYRVALNVALADFRQAKPNLAYTDVVPDRVEESDSSVQLFRQEALIGAMKRLTEADRALLAMYLDDLSYREISEVTGLSESNVGVKLSRLKKQLALMIKKE